MAGLVRLLLPACVSVVEATPAMWEAPLFPEEARYVSRAVEKRRRDFRAGRACARTALRNLGLEPRAIGVAPDGGPLWPEGVVGSISHTRDYCAAAVAWRTTLSGVGVDIERRDAVDPELVVQVCTDDEIRWMNAAPRPIGTSVADRRTLIFSAKESLYKALRPALRGTVLDFRDATLPFPPRDGAFAIELDPTRRPAAVPARLYGRFRLTEQHVMTALAWRAGPG